jgi:hypothetical protein
MNAKHKTLITFLIIFIPASIAPGVLAATHYCDSCYSCSDYLTNASSGDTIKLISDIHTDWNCIDPEEPSNIVNMTLDCDGYAIIGDDEDGRYGIYINDPTGTASNITIQNCKISDFYYSCIYISNGESDDYITIQDSELTDCGGVAIDIASSEYGTIRRVNITGTGQGIRMFSCYQPLNDTRPCPNIEDVNIYNQENIV